MRLYVSVGGDFHELCQQRILIKKFVRFDVMIRKGSRRIKIVDMMVVEILWSVLSNFSNY